MLNAIRYGLELGCGISLEQAIKSPRFGELYNKQQTLFERYPADTNEGTALRNGHLIMGQMFNLLPEREALIQSRLFDKPQFGCGIEMRSLIQYFGESLVTEAGRCLPDEAIAYAQEWKTATAERQIEIAKELFFLFRSSSQKTGGQFLTLALAQEDHIRKAMERVKRDYSNEDILPRLYGKWNEESTANCQGKAQMLTAFARMAGAEVMVACPLRGGSDELSIAVDELGDFVINDLRNRGLEKADSGFADACAGHLYRQSHKQKIDFHVGVALRLCDSRWILLDPHALVWGILSPEWEMENTYRLLSKYGEVLPGLFMIRNDHGEMTHKIQTRAEEARELIHRSRKLEEMIRKGVTSVVELVFLIRDSDDFDLLMRMNAEQEGIQVLDLSDPEFRFAVTAQVVLGGMENVFSIEKMLDPQFLPERIKAWLSFYHAIALNHLRNQLSDNGELVHPISEFSANPEYDLALSAINSLVVRHDQSSKQFFMDYEFNQLTLHNAMIGSTWERPELGRAAASVVMSMPFMHDNIRKLLEGR